MSEIDIDAIVEATATSDYERGLTIGTPVTVPRRRENDVGHLLLRFLQNCPEEATVIELREALEASKYGMRV